MDGIPVTVVTGFLGAGKTTLLDQWLQDYRRGEAAVIVNEVGAVGIDGDVLRGRVQALVEITGGCVCCTTYPELVTALTTLAAEQPKRIFVETSGAASPAGVVRAVHGSSEVRLDGIITVVDATAEQVPNHPFADLAAEQLGYADIIVLSNADCLNADALAKRSNAIGEANVTAVITSADNGVLRGHAGLNDLLQARQSDVMPSLIPVRNHQGIQTMVLAVDGEVDEDRFGDWIETGLSAFEGRLLRVKGILAIAGVNQRIILQGVANRMDVAQGKDWEDAARTCRLVIIGFALDEAALSRGFKACAL